MTISNPLYPSFSDRERIEVVDSIAQLSDKECEKLTCYILEHKFLFIKDIEKLSMRLNQYTKKHSRELLDKMGHTKLSEEIYQPVIFTYMDFTFHTHITSIKVIPVLKDWLQQVAYPALPVYGGNISIFVALDNLLKEYDVHRIGSSSIEASSPVLQYQEGKEPYFIREVSYKFTEFIDKDSPYFEEIKEVYRKNQ